LSLLILIAFAVSFFNKTKLVKVEQTMSTPTPTLDVSSTNNWIDVYFDRFSFKRPPDSLINRKTRDSINIFDPEPYTQGDLCSNCYSFGLETKSLEKGMDFEKYLIKEHNLKDGFFYTENNESAFKVNRFKEIDLNGSKALRVSVGPEGINVNNENEKPFGFEIVLIRLSDTDFIEVINELPTYIHGQKENIFDSFLKTYSPTGTKQIEMIPIKDLQNGCFIFGYNYESCSEKNKYSQNPIWPVSRDHSCYRNAVCELQTNGQCNWTQTEELKNCLSKY
jgi:hypothetical protein